MRLAPFAFIACLMAAPVPALSLASCATTSSSHLAEARGLAAAWASLDAVAVTLDNLATTRVLHGARAADAADKLGQARDALLAADAAYRAGQGATAQQNVARATVLISALVTIARSPEEPPS